MVTTTVAAGHPTIVARTIDLQAGVDPLSLVFAYGDMLIGAVAYDPISGYAVFPLPESAPPLKLGQTPVDLPRERLPGGQERRPGGRSHLDPPEHAFVSREAATSSATRRCSGSSRSAGDCLAPRPRLLVAASATRRIAKVALHRRTARTIATVKRGVGRAVRGDLEPQGLRGRRARCSARPSPTRPDRRHCRRSASRSARSSARWTSASR